MPSAFLIENRLAGATLALSSGALAPGVVSGARKEGVGAATLAAEGPFTGEAERTFLVEIDSVSGGAEVGEATFRWSRDGGASFEATGVPTSAAPIALADGVRVRFIGGAGDDFALLDRWTFKALLPGGFASATDGDPATAMRLASLEDAALVFDLGEAAPADRLVLHGHNLAAATITLEGNDADLWTSPALSVSVPFAAGTIHAPFASASHRWWRLRLEDMASADDRAAFAELFLGPGLAPETRFRDGAEETHELREVLSRSPAGATRRTAHGAARRFELRWETFVPGDLAALRSAFRAANAPGAGPLFFFHEDLGEAFLVRWASPFAFRHLEGRSEAHGIVSATLVEVAPS